jgi:hypothetical protein
LAQYRSDAGEKSLWHPNGRITERTKFSGVGGIKAKLVYSHGLVEAVEV